MDKLTRRQMRSLLFVAVISPLFRQAPGSAVGASGSGTWLSAGLAGVSFLFLGWVTLGLLPPGKGLGEALTASLGPVPGRIALGLYTIYMSLYAGFVLRSGADRFLAAVYPDSPLWVLGLALLLPVIPAVLGPAKPVGRMAELTAPFLLGLLLSVFLFALPGVQWEELSLADATPRGILRGSFPLLDALSVSVFLLFWEDRAESGGRQKGFLLPSGLLGALGVLLCLTTVGTFGPALTEKMNYPFFVMIRSVSIFQLLERAETFIVAQWVITDYVLLNVLFRAAADTAKRSLAPHQPPSRWWALPCLILSLGCALLCAGDAFRLRALSRTWVPLVNGCAAGLVPFLLLPGAFRKK